MSIGTLSLYTTTTVPVVLLRQSAETENLDLLAQYQRPKPRFLMEANLRSAHCNFAVCDQVQTVAQSKHDIMCKDIMLIMTEKNRTAK